METGWIKEENRDILREDEKGLREKMAQLSAIKESKESTKRQINELNDRITKIAQVKNMIQAGEIKKRELESQLRFYKTNLWR